MENEMGRKAKSKSIVTNLPDFPAPRFELVLAIYCFNFDSPCVRRSLSFQALMFSYEVAKDLIPRHYWRILNFNSIVITLAPGFVITILPVELFNNRVQRPSKKH